MGRERKREKYPKQTSHWAQSPAQAHSHDSEIMTLAKDKNRLPNWVSHQSTPACIFLIKHLMPQDRYTAWALVNKLTKTTPPNILYYDAKEKGHFAERPRFLQGILELGPSFHRI